MERTVKIAQARFCIEDIIFKYAEAIDGGTLESLGLLFSRAELKNADGQVVVGDDIVQHYADRVIMYDAKGNEASYQPGVTTPRTRHVTTNLIYEFNNAVDRADVRSCFTAYQTIDRANEIVAGGRYVDVFEKDLQGWHIVSREILLDNWGDTSRLMRR